MVNTGGPSKGCVTCIQRKIRCDRQRPVCGQCQKGKRECGGYRNETDLMFRDQSQTFYAQGHAASLPQATEPEKVENLESADFIDNSTAKPVTWIESDIPAVVPSLRLNAENGLIDFFTNNFTCGFSSKGTNLFWLPNNIGDLLKEDCARLSVQSVGAMALARLRRSAYYFREAQRNYGLALLSLNKSLKEHHSDVVKNAILVTVLFLGFFEVLASYDNSSRQSWTTHLGGIGALLNQRREEFFLDGNFGAKMLKQSRSQTIVNALQTKTPVPEPFQTLSHRFPRAMPPNLVASDDADVLLIHVANLQARYQKSGPSMSLFSDLTGMNSDLCQWSEHLIPFWYFSKHSCNTPSELWWDLRCDSYSMPVISNIWNKIRTARILVHDLIQEISLHLSTNSENNTAFSLHHTNSELPSPRIQDLVIDICATIPMYYRLSSAITGSDSGTQPLLGTTYWLLWPLEVIGSMREASPSLTEWVLQVLERIHETTGIVKAQLVADRLRAKSTGVILV